VAAVCAAAVIERPFGAFGRDCYQTMRQGRRMIRRSGRQPGMADPLPRCRNPVPARGIVSPRTRGVRKNMRMTPAFRDEGGMKIDQTVRYGLLLQLVKTVLASVP